MRYLIGGANDFGPPYFDFGNTVVMHSARNCVGSYDVMYYVQYSVNIVKCKGYFFYRSRNFGLKVADLYKSRDFSHSREVRALDRNCDFFRTNFFFSSFRCSRPIDFQFA